MKDLHFLNDHLTFRALFDIAIILSWILVYVTFLELTRFIYHALHHESDFLYRKMHKWHHKTYKDDFKNKNYLAYRKGFWLYDLPEASSMIIAGFLLFYGTFSSESLSHQRIIGATFGIFYALKEISLVVFKFAGFHWAIKADINHSGDSLPYAKPSQLKVNLSYHWRHHFQDERAYLSGIHPSFDHLWGTAISLNSRHFACLGSIDNLMSPLQAILSRCGSTIDFEFDFDDDLYNVDILVINLLSTERTFEELIEVTNRFFSSIKSIRDVALKEIWILFPESELFPGLQTYSEIKEKMFSDATTLMRLDAPCIIRKIVIDKTFQDSVPSKVVQDLIISIHRDSRNFTPGKPTISFWYKLKELTSISFCRLRKKHSQDSQKFIGFNQVWSKLFY